MGVRQRGDRWFVDVSVNGHRKTATCPSKAEAEVKEAELRHALLVGKEVSSRRSNARSWTLQEALDFCLSKPAKEGWKGTSYEKVGGLNVRDAILFMGPSITLDAIDRDRIDAWLQHCEANGNSNATLNRKLAAISKVLRLAHDYDGLDAMPKMPKRRKERVGRIRFLTHDEEGQMMAYWNHVGRPDMANFVTVLIETGMRRGEAMNLRPQDVDLKTGVIMVYGKEDEGTKNGRIRSVPMTTACGDAITQHMSGARVFDLTEAEIRTQWANMRGHLGMEEDPDFVLHICRHTCASRLVKAGVSLPVVKDWLGHSSIITTMRYAHLFPQDLMNAAASLERVAEERCAAGSWRWAGPDCQ
jgi:integrase